ncbi:ANR family transcriptional regulator [Aeromonas jandaei]
MTEMRGRRVRSKYMPTADKAALMERQGEWDAAGRLWRHAAIEAVRAENKAWAESRGSVCEHKLKQQKGGSHE